MFSEFLFGVFITLALVGVGLLGGWWWSRRFPRKLTTEELEPTLLKLLRFTNNFSRDVSEYNAVIATANVQARELANQAQTPGTSTEASEQLLSQIMQANEHLQQRLVEAESSLHTQAQQLQTYMNEARTDALTGVPNRRSFDEELNRRFGMFRRLNVKTGVMLLDVDRFKSVNDQYGHAVGDAVLKGIAETLRRSVRESDLLARYGGEEFAVLLAGNSNDEFRLAAERLRRAVESVEVISEGHVLHPTVSCGVTQIESCDDTHSVLGRADEALYAAKHGGRNCSFWHNGEHTIRIIPGEMAHADTYSPGSDQFRELCSQLRRKLQEITHSS